MRHIRVTDGGLGNTSVSEEEQLVEGRVGHLSLRFSIGLSIVLDRIYHWCFPGGTVRASCGALLWAIIGAIVTSQSDPWP
jgi:hypothetical protein